VKRVLDPAFPDFDRVARMMRASPTLHARQRVDADQNAATQPRHFRGQAASVWRGA
jgi:hypothetical protein